MISCGNQINFILLNVIKANFHWYDYWFHIQIEWNLFINIFQNLEVEYFEDKFKEAKLIEFEIQESTSLIDDSEHFWNE